MAVESQSKIFDRGWIDIEATNNMKIQLRYLQKDEIKDVPDQDSSFFIRIDGIDLTSMPPVKDYSIPFFKKLEPEKQKKFLHLIQEYHVKGWWSDHPSEGKL